MCVFVPLFAVTLHGPQSISPQHPSLCLKKEKFSFPPLSLSFSLIYNPGHRLVVFEESAVGPISRPTAARLCAQILSVYDEIDWMKMFIIFLAWNPGSVWPPLLLQQNTSGGEGGSLQNAFLLQEAHMCSFTALIFSAEKQICFFLDINGARGNLNDHVSVVESFYLKVRANCLVALSSSLSLSFSLASEF